MSEIAVAARRLSVYPSICRCRLARAREVFGFALAEAGEHLRLWLQLRFSDQLGFGTCTPSAATPLTGPTPITRLGVRGVGAQPS